MPPKKKKKEEKIIPLEVQPVVNIGLVGHVDHGKTSLTERLTGKWTDTHSEEIKRGITIRLGYANVVFRKCLKCDFYTVKEKCEKCNGETNILRKVSFVDAPGHESLMATMLAGATIMDGALLLVAANERCPQPQTKEHLMALEIVGIKKVIVVQNKIDLVNDEQAKKNYDQIKSFLKGTSYENSPIIPISAAHNVNIDLLIKTIEDIIITPERDESKDPLMFIARSFDINKPGTLPEKLLGGVLGGAVRQGIFKTNDTIEIRPGYEVEERNQKIRKPLTTKIVSIKSGEENIEKARPGGSVAFLTLLDPSIVKSDSLVGNVVGLPGKLPPVHYELKLKVKLLERVVGAEEDLKVGPIKMGEIIMLNTNSAATIGTVVRLSKDLITCKLKIPVCAETGSRVTISRKVATRFRLIGYGIIEQ
ncbi:MAG: translation initiation factor IF-2 subunit gamma [Candidatus Woesearchaeota archaeon]